MVVPGLEMVVQRAWGRWVRAGRLERAKPAVGRAGWELTYTARYKVTVASIFGAFTALYAGGFFLADILRDEPEWKRWALAAGSLLIWLLLAAVCLGSWVERVTVTDEGVERRSWRGVQSFPWEEVQSFRILHEEEALDLRSPDGRTLRISLFLDGLGSLEPYLVRRFGASARGVFGPVLMNRPW